MNDKIRVMIMIIILLLVVASFFVVYRKAYITGARIACKNTGMFLNQNFICKESKENKEEEETWDITNVVIV